MINGIESTLLAVTVNLKIHRESIRPSGCWTGRCHIFFFLGGDNALMKLSIS